jgi:hypothetical protein
MEFRLSWEDTSVGQVKTAVRLTNVGDALLQQQGQRMPEAVRTYTTEALIDTGATRCVLPVFVVEQLGLADWGVRSPGGLKGVSLKLM